MDNLDIIERVIQLANNNVAEGGRPFSCIITRGDEIIAERANQVAQTNDPTAHAETLAIQDACKKLGTEHLTDCEIYILASPCPMCLGAMYYCSPQKVTYITTREEYKTYYRDDRKYFELENFYDEFSKSTDARRLPMTQVDHSERLAPYKLWNEKHGTNKA
ncbi:nucleoside deaminase [Planococcus sp. ANT_H30]|uniref:Cytidine deaminase n=1 Tax=Planococcus kocurii TaxID=1374 RepID=A0ABM5WT55_9BACL|nr:nucleoside deaminase [Planococcus kocurii]ALS77420.1 cytidine deaminase [Planococcus kocurii]KAA0959201.1 nucleoside deaminase [Planococcus sp. ANT_H30]